MSRRGPATVAAALAGLAFLASLPVPCPCLPETAEVRDHGCCAPAAGWRASAPGCCAATAEPAPETKATTPAVASAVLPALVAVGPVMPSAPATTQRVSDSPDSLHSPPLTARRV